MYVKDRTQNFGTFLKLKFNDRNTVVYCISVLLGDVMRRTSRKGQA